MRSERVEIAGILTPQSLFKGMADSGIHPQVAGGLYSHEKAHADADEERRGEFGFYITGGWIVAYYLIKGERTPEQLMKIASAPGFSSMSSQDWKIYNSAWRQWLKQVHEKRFQEKSKPQTYDDLRNLLIDKLAERLNALAKEGKFPELKDLLGYEFMELVYEYGPTLYQVYKEALGEIKHLLISRRLEDEAEGESGDKYVAPR